MRIANRAGRASLVSDHRSLDIERASGGAFCSDLQALWARFDEFAAWAADIDVDSRDDAEEYRPEELEAAVPRPPQVFAIGVNYRDHAAESDIAVPEHPVVFTKFVSSLTGPRADVRLSGDTVDWEIEMVAVIGRGGRDIPESEGWDHVAGLTIGQDISDRTVQWQVSPAQFSTGKSFPGFGPIGPDVRTRDEWPDGRFPEALGLRTVIVAADESSEQEVQVGTTADLVFSVPALVARLSAVVTLLPGDIIFTGTPSGVGMGRKPPQYLTSGQTLVSSIEGLGELRNHMV